MNTKQSFAIKGDICFCKTKDQWTTMKNAYAVCETGISHGVFAQLPEQYAHFPVYDFTGKLIIPGLVDLHMHAPQYAFRGMGMDLELMDWLGQQTFPEEAKYADLSYADKAYTIFADNIKHSATSHACLFVTQHRAATELLMDRMEQTGMISFVGKVNMDREAPDNLRESSAEASAQETLRWLYEIAGKYQRTKPILTPRFIPSCTPELLAKLQIIQQEYKLPVQSHLSENTGEIAFVHELCPDARFYGDAYDAYGLFGRQHPKEHIYPAIMAHCVHSTEEEIKLLRDNGVFVAHCPASNTNLSSGIAPIRRYLENHMHVGLGSDVAGGHTESILRAVCDAVQVSKLYWRLVDDGAVPLTFCEAFYLATKGGGAFFGSVGSLERGYDFSAVVLDDSSLRHPFALTIPQRLERAAYSALDAYGICAKFVSGTLLFDHTHSK